MAIKKTSNLLKKQNNQTNKKDQPNKTTTNKQTNHKMYFKVVTTFAAFEALLPNTECTA